jgi:WD40 repeat protein
LYRHSLWLNITGWSLPNSQAYFVVQDSQIYLFSPSSILIDLTLHSTFSRPINISLRYTPLLRVLIIFRDGIITLWDMKASKAVSISGKTIQQLSHQEAKTVTSVCWVCAKGSKIALGYDNGDLYFWAVPEILSAQNSPSMGSQNLPLQRLNLGYKLDKMPIVSLQWVSCDGKAGHLYINGFNDHGQLFQVEHPTYFSKRNTELLRVS